MGSCLTKKKDSSSSSVAAATVPVPAPVKSSTVTVDPKKLDDSTQNVLLSKQEPKKKDNEAKQEDGLVKKEIFVIKHRKSHDKRSVIPQQNEEADAAAAVNVVEVEREEIGNGTSIPNGVVRTSSCTKEEVDAILIQCGRLSRSNSSGKTASSARKYSGSKRSYDFDHDNERERDGGDDNSIGDVKKKSSDDDQDQIQRQHRPRHRQSSRQSPASSSHGRRRTPSREREQQQSQQRSGSTERGGGGSSSGRRVSRSPGRRSENNQVNATSANANTNRPGKLVSVPASVTCLVMDKSNNNGPVEPATATNATSIKRISVKRNAGEAVGSRTAASPRSQSPARTNANSGKNSNENQQQQPCLSRNSSRKAEHSPYRRNPLSEIDPNALSHPQSACNNKTSSANNNRGYNKNRETEGDGVLYQTQIQKPNSEILAPQGTNSKASSRGTLNNKVAGMNIIEREHQQQILEEAKTQLPMTGNAMVTSVAESQKPQSLTRSRSSRRSRDLDFNPETLLNPAPSYAALLLEDIQNFHQKNTPSVSLPACVSKAHSILEAVADLNSTTSSNLSCAYSEDRKTPTADQSNNKNAYNFSAGINLVGKKMTEAKDPFVESEIFATDDLMEPSFHRYVTVRRGGGTLGTVDLDEQESSGSNSFVSGSQQNWNFSSSSWEPNSADSTDRWTSRSNTKEEDQSPLGFQRHAALPESGRKGFSGKKRDTDYQQGGNWRGRVPVVAAAAST